MQDVDVLFQCLLMDQMDWEEGKLMYSSVPYIYWQGRNKNVYIHDKVTKIRYNKNIKLYY